MFHFPVDFPAQSIVQLPISTTGMSPVLRMPEVRMRHIKGNLGSTKISNITNSSDPEAICARLFVGNLNTLVLSKEAVEAVFRRYGEIVGISMHKGYAFIQYDKETDARNAVTGEDQRVYAGKQIDVNLATEPRKTQKRKRHYEAITNSIQSPSLRSGVNYSCPNKRPLNGPIPSTQFLLETDERRLPVPQPATNDVTRTKSNQPCPLINGRNAEICDILICGHCKQLFTDLDCFVDHKHRGCSSPTHCQCHIKRTRSSSTDQSGDEMSAPSTNSMCDKNTEWEGVSSSPHNMDQYSEKHDGDDPVSREDPTHESHPTGSLENYPVFSADNDGHVTP